MKTALCTIAFKELDVERVLDLARDNALDGVEIWGKEPHMGDAFDAERCARVRDAVAARGLVVSALGSYIKPEMEDFESHGAAALDIAAALGTNVVRIWAGGGASAQVTCDVYGDAVVALRRFCPQAEARGITLAFESHDNTIADNARGILRLIDEVGSPALKTYYQPSRRDGADDPYEAAELLGPHVVNVHAQNFDAERAGRAPVGKGMVDYRRVAEILKRHGFDGYLEIEFVGEEDKFASLAADAAFLKQLAAES